MCSLTRMTWHMMLLLLMQTLTGGTAPPATTYAHPPVRLVYPSGRCSGRVEVFQNDQWGTVCDDIWGLPQAEVVCRQVGCGRAVAAPQAAHFGPGTGPIWLDDLRCTGNESAITDCAHQGFGLHNCNHGEDASVICEDINSTVSTVTPNVTRPHPPIRLVHSTSRCSGRVEVFQNDQWGTVCDDIWGLPQAEVVCRQVGCGRAVAAPQAAHFGPGTGPIWLDDLRCTGNESAITDCAHQGFGLHNCNHGEDAGVICEDINGTPSTTRPSATTPFTSFLHPPIRLVHSTSHCSGRVEVFLNDQWGTVCDDIWGLPQAEVVCRQVGCGGAVAAPQAAHFGPGTGPIWLDDLRCTGNESAITDCAHQGFGLHNCNHGEDASVICEDEQSLLNASQLVCTRHHLEVGVNLRILLSDLNVFSGHMAAPSCATYRIQDNVVWYQVPRQAGLCGTVLTTNSTHAIYSNSLFLYPPSNGSLLLPESIPFSCAYPLETRASLTSLSLVQEGGLRGSGTGATAHMNLFSGSDFVSALRQGRSILPLGSPLHVGVFVTESDPTFVLVLDDCYITQSSNPDDPVRYFLIHSRCLTDRQRVSVVENGVSLRARFSALAFPLQGSSIFLHCRVSLCDSRSNNCLPFCMRRTRRSLPTSTQLNPLTIGPITWEN